MADITSTDSVRITLSMNLEEAKALHLAIDVDETIERYADAENVAKYRKAALAIEDLVYREIEKVEARG